MVTLGCVTFSANVFHAWCLIIALQYVWAAKKAFLRPRYSGHVYLVAASTISDAALGIHC